jgi:hypothetical protein
MRSPEELRAEVRRLHQTVRTSLDPALRKNLSERALGLAQQAEAIAGLPEDVEGLSITIAHYRRMLAGADNPAKRQLIGEVLQHAEHKLRQVVDKKGHRVA